MADCICVCRGDGPEGCGICNETGTTPDIASLCEKLRAFNAGGYRKEAADTLERQAAEIERLREALEAKADEGMLVLETLAKMTPDRAHRHVRDGLAIAREARAALTGEDTASV